MSSWSTAPSAGSLIRTLAPLTGTTGLSVVTDTCSRPCPV